MFQDQLLKDKTIIVTGGGTGLGKSMASRFGELGANLVICSRRKKVIDEAAKELEKTGAEAVGIQCDVRDGEEVSQMVGETVSKFGSVDVLLNNAAGNFVCPTERLSENAFRTVVDIVLTGTFNCSMAVNKNGSAIGSLNRLRQM